MKTRLSFLIPLCVLSLTLFVAGCGPSAGETGDVNDPEATSDADQMQDETGEI